MDDLEFLDSGDDPTEGTFAELSQRWLACNRLMARLRDVSYGLELEMAARMEADALEVPHVGVATRYRAKSGRWRDPHSSEALRAEIAERITKRLALQPTTGELDPVVVNVSRLVFELVWDVVPAFSSVKAAGRRLGIDMEDFREESEVIRVKVEPFGAES